MEGEFNPKNKLPGSFTVDGETKAVRYNAYGANANIDGSENLFTRQPTIQDNEAAGMGIAAWKAQSLYRLVGQVAYTKAEKRLLSSSLVVTVVREVPNNQFLINDFLVTVESAKYPGFSYLGTEKLNHSTIGNDRVAESVITFIKSMQNGN